MTNHIEKTIILTGEDALRFAYSFYRPSADDIKLNRERIESINNNISINRTDYGFEAVVKDVDMSFLNEISSDNKVSIETVFQIDYNSSLISSDENNNISTIKINAEERVLIPLDSDFITLAA